MKEEKQFTESEFDKLLNQNAPSILECKERERKFVESMSIKCESAYEMNQRLLEQEKEKRGWIW